MCSDARCAVTATPPPAPPPPPRPRDAPTTTWLPAGPPLQPPPPCSASPPATGRGTAKWLLSPGVAAHHSSLLRSSAGQTPRSPGCGTAAPPLPPPRPRARRERGASGRQKQLPLALAPAPAPVPSRRASPPRAPPAVVVAAVTPVGDGWRAVTAAAAAAETATGAGVVLLLVVVVVVVSAGAWGCGMDIRQGHLVQGSERVHAVVHTHCSWGHGLAGLMCGVGAASHHPHSRRHHHDVRGKARRVRRGTDCTLTNPTTTHGPSHTPLQPACSGVHAAS